MNPFTTPDRIFISRHPHDMRAGIQRLATIATADFGHDPTDGALYVFISRTCDKAKMLRFETNGWCMYYLRLCEGAFKWQHVQDSDDPLLVIERRQLIWLLEGLEINQAKAPLPLTASTIL